MYVCMNEHVSYFVDYCHMQARNIQIHGKLISQW